MVLEVHHLHLSQSERLVWLLEELGIDYELKVYDRDPKTALAPSPLKSLNPTGTAPYFKDTSTTPEIRLSESTAAMAYILAAYPPSPSGTAMARHPGDPDYGPYLDWFHYANGSLQSSMSKCMSLMLSGVATTSTTSSNNHHPAHAKLLSQLALIDARLATTKAWLAGPDPTAADCMLMFSLSTMRGFYPLDLGPYPGILRWMAAVAARPAYRRALLKGDKGMEPMIQPQARRFTEFPAFKAVLDDV